MSEASEQAEAERPPFSTSDYLCHNCGTRLLHTEGRMLWCKRCGARRRTPTDPHLTAGRLTSPPPGE